MSSFYKKFHHNLVKIQKDSVIYVPIGQKGLTDMKIRNIAIIAQVDRGRTKIDGKH